MCGEAGAPPGRRWSLGPGAPKPLPVLLVTRPSPAARRGGGGARLGRRGRDGVPVSMWALPAAAPPPRWQRRRQQRDHRPGPRGGGGEQQGGVCCQPASPEPAGEGSWEGRGAPRAAAPSLRARPPPKVLCRLFPREGEIYALHYCSSPPPSKQDGLSRLSLSLTLSLSLVLSPSPCVLSAFKIDIL